MDALASKADQSTIEHGMCLIGTVQYVPPEESVPGGASVVMVDAGLPPIGETPRGDGKRGVRFTCPYASTVGIWHNHLYSEYQKLPLGPWTWPDAPTPQSAACQLSQADLLDALMQPVPLFVIGVDKHTFCWWFTDDLRTQYGDGSTREVGDLPLATRPAPEHLRYDWGIEK